jgi:hypothetical protein
MVEFQLFSHDFFLQTVDLVSLLPHCLLFLLGWLIFDILYEIRYGLFLFEFLKP